MTTVHIALLRGINVGGHKKVAMAELCGLLDGMGFDGARTRLQTGNLVFRSDKQTGAALEKALEAEAAKRLDLHTDFLVRTADEWANVIARNPFPSEAETDPSHLVVMFLKDAPAIASIKTLQAAVSGPEVIRAGGRHLYITYPAGIGRSRLTNSLVEAKLGTRGTSRNWNTVLKLADLAHGLTQGRAL